MKRNTVLIILAATAILVIVSAWLANTVYTKFSSYQTQIAELQTQNSELETQIGQLQNQTSSLESQNSKLMIQLGDLTKQLALERHLNIEIVFLSHDAVWGSYGAMLVYYGWNVTVRNNDVVTVSGLDLSVKAYSGLVEYGSPFNFPFDVGLLNAGEEKVVSGMVIMNMPGLVNFTYVATLKSADVVLDTFTLQP